MIHLDGREIKENINGEVTLNGSKSISNRALIIKYLCNDSMTIQNLSNANDTVVLNNLLSDINASTFDAQDAGTSFRFMTALLAFRKGTQILTGSERMKQRPIGPLVDALRMLGAKIDYLENDGFPPLSLKAPDNIKNNVVELPANISSQYISALLLIGPSLANGLKINLKGEIVSRPYINMTIKLMSKFEVNVFFEHNEIKVEKQAYKGGNLKVEADWSAASYYYGFAALATKAKIKLHGLFEDSIQGDAVLSKMLTEFGVQTTFEADGVLLSKEGPSSLAMFEYDFTDCPDLAQTLMSICSGTKVVGLFSGLESLKIKECNRVEAMTTELMKFGTTLVQLPSRFSENKEVINYVLESFDMEVDPKVVIETFNDHRMAMALAPLSLLHNLSIKDPEVVNKSYPQFWMDIKSLGINSIHQSIR